MFRTRSSHPSYTLAIQSFFFQIPTVILLIRAHYYYLPLLDWGIFKEVEAKSKSSGGQNTQKEAIS